MTVRTVITTCASTIVVGTWVVATEVPTKESVVVVVEKL